MSIRETASHVANMVSCRKGTHCLFRAFGLGVIDDPAPTAITLGSVRAECAKWYPNIDVEKLERKRDGDFAVVIKSV